MKVLCPLCDGCRYITLRFLGIISRPEKCPNCNGSGVVEPERTPEPERKINEGLKKLLDGLKRARRHT